MDSSETTYIVEGFENIPIIITGINPAIEVETGLGIQNQVLNDRNCTHFYGRSVWRPLRLERCLVQRDLFCKTGHSSGVDLVVATCGASSSMWRCAKQQII